MIRRATRPGAIGLLLLAAALSAAALPVRPERASDGALEGARLIGARPLAGELFHVQGLALDGPRLWITSVDRIHRKGYLHAFDRASGALIRRIELTDGARYHPGGISMSGRSIWIPVAELRPTSSTTLVAIDADTLQVKRRIAVADHLGCVAARGDTLVAGNWDSRLLYVIDPTGQRPLRIVPNPSGTHYQDMKFADGGIVAGGDRSWWSGTVDWLDWPSLKTRRSLRAGTVGLVRPYTGEGMAIEGRDLYVVPEDGPSRLFHFRLKG